MAPPNVLMVGTGEYTTGFVGGGMSGSDKKVGQQRICVGYGMLIIGLGRRRRIDDVRPPETWKSGQAQYGGHIRQQVPSNP